MTTPADIVTEFKSTPFELYYLKNKEFTIVEDIDRRTGQIREVKEISKWGKPTDFYFIRVEQGLFQKDMKLSKSELQSIMLVVPESVKNLQGVMLSVDLMKGVKYMGNTAQDINGTKLGSNTPTTPQSAPITQNRGISIESVLSGMKGFSVPPSTMISALNQVSPGKALDLIQQAKAKGLITEKEDGDYKVN